MQIPLAPALAITAHAAQCHTFKKEAIVDLSIGAGTSPVVSYFALTILKNMTICPYTNHSTSHGSTKALMSAQNCQPKLSEAKRSIANISRRI